MHTRAHTHREGPEEPHRGALALVRQRGAHARQRPLGLARTNCAVASRCSPPRSVALKHHTVPRTRPRAVNGTAGTDLRKHWKARHIPAGSRPIATAGLHASHGARAVEGARLWLSSSAAESGKTSAKGLQKRRGGAAAAAAAALGLRKTAMYSCVRMKKSCKMESEAPRAVPVQHRWRLMI